MLRNFRCKHNFWEKSYEEIWEQPTHAHTHNPSPQTKKTVPRQLADLKYSFLKREVLWKLGKSRQQKE